MKVEGLTCCRGAGEGRGDLGVQPDCRCRQGAEALARVVVADCMAALPAAQKEGRGGWRRGAGVCEKGGGEEGKGRMQGREREGERKAKRLLPQSKGGCRAKRDGPCVHA
jgi:hypothetical protein